MVRVVRAVRALRRRIVAKRFDADDRKPVPYSLSRLQKCPLKRFDSGSGHRSGHRSVPPGTRTHGSRPYRPRPGARPDSAEQREPLGVRAQ